MNKARTAAAKAMAGSDRYGDRDNRGYGGVVALAAEVVCYY